MEWWESNDYEAVHEIGDTWSSDKRKDVAARIYDRNARRLVSGGDPNKLQDRNYRAMALELGGNGKTVRQAKKARIVGKAIAGGTVAATGVAVGYGLYKGGKSLYNKVKNRNTDKEEKAANESWYDDPGAISIMESYFSEFADADIYSDTD
jgi:hypothetical protein